MARKAKKILGPGFARKYYSALAIVYEFFIRYPHVLVKVYLTIFNRIESGAIYSLYVLIDQILITVSLSPKTAWAPSDLME